MRGSNTRMVGLGLIVIPGARGIGELLDVIANERSHVRVRKIMTISHKITTTYDMSQEHRIATHCEYLRKLLGKLQYSLEKRFE